MLKDDKLIIPLRKVSADAELIISSEKNVMNSLFEKEDASEYGEAYYQIKEGCNYEYKISDGFLLETNEVVSRSKFTPSTGRISPGIYVGTLQINILKADTQERCSNIMIEVQSVKTSYRKDYRTMLEEITEKCTDLILHYSSLASHNLKTDYEIDSRTLYQRFAFIKSILETEEFRDSLHRILSSPVTDWKITETTKDIRNIGRIRKDTIRQIAISENRTFIPDLHPLKEIISTLPQKITVDHKTETADIPENRFIKHALLTFRTFLSDFRVKIKESNRLTREILFLEENLNHFLNHSVFREISPPSSFPLNSPVLQRKEGYREVLRAWLMFELAAKLAWEGGEDVYRGNMRDVAVLYEYWLFFRLLDILKEIFNINPKSISELIKETNDGLGLQLKQGKHIALIGEYSHGTRKFTVEFSYNRTFSVGKEYPDSGSWTRKLRPDYTLSIWPSGINKEQAEIEELIVHIHFDAKYKVEPLLLDDQVNLDEERKEQKKGTYKNADIMKMHTYRDAIRRTAGAYVLYPGTVSEYKTGFHELLPGLGAFALRPSKVDDGSAELKKFLYDVLDHFQNRASQREKMSLKVYEIHKDKHTRVVNETLPETYGDNRNLLPDETFVIVAFYNNTEVLDWILNKKLYNARTGTRRGSLRLGPKESGAKYLLLHTHNELISDKIFKITVAGPKVLSKQELIDKGYPANITEDGDEKYYFVYDVSSETEPEFKNLRWDISKLPGYKKGQASPLPFTVSLTELMNSIVK